mmetsp:Transcript_56629/g.165623  ORF Transcript_56629/g.165623 Transcript_56629/m.165623 type:complete len:663 (+) Transcript_56629:91-2079(+)
MNCYIILGAVLTVSGHAISDFQPLPEQAGCHIPDETSLLQAWTGIKMREKEAKLIAETEVAVGFEDASSFAQTQVQVDVAVPEEAATAEVDFLPDLEQQQNDDEEMTCSLQGLTPGVCAMAALARSAAPAAGASDFDFLHPQRLERALFSEIEAALAGTHAGFSAADFADLERELAGLFAALPKNEAGLLGHAAVRYALHQRFLRRHGWYMRSLNPAGEAQMPSSPGEELRGHVPEHLQVLIEKRQDGRGIGLRELTALVATLEHLIQGDMGERLKAAYDAHGLLHNGTAQKEEAAEVLQTLMAHFLSLAHRSGYAVSPEQAQRERKELETSYGGWSHVVDLSVAVVSQATDAQELHFADVLSAAKVLMERFESYSTEECRDLKQTLSAMPGGTAGRVHLADFHRDAIDGTMLFAESTNYLTALGAIDESTPGSPMVLVPNYIYSPSNCLGTTSFFDLCCPNECEAILEDLEQDLQAAEAAPSDITSALHRRVGWRSSAPLLSELQEAARKHGGRLAVHGLAFAQWLNHAFPRECPRPRAEDFKHHSGDAAELPDAEREFQEVAEVPLIASRDELLEELQGNVSFTAPAVLDAGDELENVAAKIIGQSATSSSRGLKVLTGLDSTSLAQTKIETAPAPQEATSVVTEEPQSSAQLTSDAFRV